MTWIGVSDVAYEFKDKVINILKNLGALYNSNINFRMADEVEEVYIKAKAFDEIVNLRNNHYYYSKLPVEHLLK